MKCRTVAFEVSITLLRAGDKPVACYRWVRSECRRVRSNVEDHLPRTLCTRRRESWDLGWDIAGYVDERSDLAFLTGLPRLVVTLAVCASSATTHNIIDSKSSGLTVSLPLPSPTIDHVASAQPGGPCAAVGFGRERVRALGKEAAAVASLRDVRSGAASEFLAIALHRIVTVDGDSGSCSFPNLRPFCAGAHVRR